MWCSSMVCGLTFAYVCIYVGVAALRAKIPVTEAIPMLSPPRARWFLALAFHATNAPSTRAGAKSARRHTQPQPCSDTQ